MSKKVKKEKKPTDKLADKTLTTRVLQGVFGNPEKRKLKRMKKIVQGINKLEPKYQAMSDQELQEQTNILKERLLNLRKKAEAKVALAKQAKATEKPQKSKNHSQSQSTSLAKEEDKVLDQLLPDAFAIVRESTFRVLGMRHFDVQLIGGIALHEGNVAEMKTGEGKTLVATMPSYLRALTGKGVHVVTVNDYLAKYQSDLMARVYNFLGLTVGCVLVGQEPQERREQYNADITYGTNNEFGFDYLRDNMAQRPEDLVQRGHNFVIVDEVDSILIDEARTPLIISGPASGDVNRWYTEFARIANILVRDEDYEVDEKKKTIGVLEPGIDKGYSPRLGIIVMHFHSILRHIKGDIRGMKKII